MLQKSKLIERPDTQPCASDDLGPLDVSDLLRAAVLAVVSVVAHHKIFIITQRDRFCRTSRILNRLCTIIFFQQLTIDVNIAILINLYRLSR